ncbi:MULTISPECIES: LLM class flavin-dependent oxidoreductase [Subtercola]|nr:MULTISPECIES: LLM class flavin-dependent oxidoreductase [Subtercola]MEA9986751.1 LLM class flavin-dependent oxidoreductase [Subtercola sp. RTI3]
MQLSFLSFVPNHGGPRGAAASLADGVRLFQTAEREGYDTGWVRVRHFEPYLSSPMVFLSAVAQRTSSLHFGTGVLPMRYEDPIRVAEDAATLDLMSGGRLELGLSSGIPTQSMLDPVFGPSELSFSAEAQKRALRLRAVLAGDALINSGEGYMSIPPHTDLTLSPPVPGLAERLWYGSGTVAGARRTGAQGFDLQVSTLNGEETGVSFDEGQLQQILAYKEAFAAGQAAGTISAARVPRIAAGRIIVPLLTDEDRAVHREFIEGYESGMGADGRPLDPRVPLRFSRILAGHPDEIVDALLADRALPHASQLMVTLPANGAVASHERILRIVRERIAPALLPVLA